MERKFKIILEWNEDGRGYTVTAPALPGFVTEGDTIQEAIKNAQEAIFGYFEALKLQKQPLPEKDSQIFFNEIELFLRS